MATDIKYRIFMGQYIGVVTKCLSSEVVGYQQTDREMAAVYRQLWQTRDDDKLYLYRRSDKHDLFVECPRIDVPQPEHLRKVVTDWQVPA